MGGAGGLCQRTHANFRRRSGLTRWQLRVCSGTVGLLQFVGMRPGAYASHAQQRLFVFHGWCLLAVRVQTCPVFPRPITEHPVQSSDPFLVFVSFLVSGAMCNGCGRHVRDFKSWRMSDRRAPRDIRRPPRGRVHLRVAVLIYLWSGVVIVVRTLVVFIWVSASRWGFRASGFCARKTRVVSDATALANGDVGPVGDQCG